MPGLSIKYGSHGQPGLRAASRQAGTLRRSAFDARRPLMRSAFVAVRRRYQRTYDVAGAGGAIAPAALISAVRSLVVGGFRGRPPRPGRSGRAARCLCRHRPGPERPRQRPVSPLPRDIAVLAADAAGGGVDAYEKAFEVRDKPVRFSDVALFGRTCVDRGVREAAMVLLAESQPAIDLEGGAAAPVFWTVG